MLANTYRIKSTLWKSENKCEFQLGGSIICVGYVFVKFTRRKGYPREHHWSSETIGCVKEKSLNGCLRRKEFIYFLIANFSTICQKGIYVKYVNAIKDWYTVKDMTNECTEVWVEMQRSSHYFGFVPRISLELLSILAWISEPKIWVKLYSVWYLHMILY